MPSIFIALRYLFSRKEKTVINLISWISLAGITVSTIALVVVMSVYNGIGELTQSLFNVFDPELLVEPSQGKTFHTSDIDYYALQRTDGVAHVSQIVEENAWITLRQAEAIVQLRGVDSSYGASSGLDTMLAEGQYLLKDSDTLGDFPFLVLGWNIMTRLGVNSMTNRPLAVHIPKRGSSSLGFSLDEAFNNGYAYPAGTFRIQEEIDNLYVVTDIDFVRMLMGYDSDEVTSLAITSNGQRSLENVKKNLRHLLGDGYTVKDRFDQKPLYYKIFRSERLGVFLILSLIVLISTLNLVASLSLLIINKTKDIATLRSMGMERRHIRKTFFTEGVLIALVGVVSGLVLGFVICLLQQHFGIVKLGANAVVDAFPVAMRVVDFIATFLIVVFLSSFVVWLTVRRAKI
ncbi:MAG: ABC transporter permease [Bacteroidales bacterium]|nr:ABC transporter permease [Bacteroidales bacterium]